MTPRPLGRGRPYEASAGRELRLLLGLKIVIPCSLFLAALVTQFDASREVVTHTNVDREEPGSR